MDGNDDSSQLALNELFLTSFQNIIRRERKSAFWKLIPLRLQRRWEQALF